MSLLDDMVADYETAKMSAENKSNPRPSDLVSFVVKLDAYLADLNAQLIKIDQLLASEPRPPQPLPDPWRTLDIGRVQVDDLRAGLKQLRGRVRAETGH